jgi:MerR family redox-sensitive transcriptional activator SoxR
LTDDHKVPVEVRLKTRELSVGDLARLTGARPSAIRYYEACGLLPAPARRSGRRRYDHALIERVRHIIAARRLGFTIAEIRRLATTGIHDRRSEAQAKAHSLRVLIAKLGANADQLDDLANCDCKSGSACRL